MEPDRGSAPGRGRGGRVRRGHRGDRPLRRRRRVRRHRSGHGPRRRGAREPAGRRDPDQDARDARRRDRSGNAHRPRPGRRAVDGRDRPCPRARPGRSGRILARRGRGRLHPRRRAQLAQPQLRGGREQRHGDRGGDRRRPDHPHRRGQRSGAVLGAARRRRQLRHRHRDRVHPLPGAGGLRRRHVLADRAGCGSAARVARPRAVAAGVDDDRRPAADAAADPGDPGAAARTQVRGGRDHPPRGRTGRCRAAGAAARARARDGHDRNDPGVRAVGAAHGSGAPGARLRRRHAAG